MAVKYDCVSCRKQVTATKNNRYRSHTNGDGDNCDMSSVEIPEHLLGNPVGEDDKPDVPRDGVDFAVCVECGRKTKLTRLGYFEPHDETLRGGEKCLMSGVRYRPEETVESPLLTEPGTSEVPKVRDSAPLAGTGSVEAGPPVEAAVIASEGVSATAKANLERTPMESAPNAGSSVSTASSSPESATTLPVSPEWTEVSDSFLLQTVHAMLMDAAGVPETPATAGSSDTDRQQGGEFDDLLFEKPPSRYPSRSKNPPRKMTERELEVATRIRETFYAYTNRNAKDNRSAQTTLGPSEAGSSCDRQIAMKLLGVTPVNPQEGWAPFVGTAVHKDLAAMFEWANGSGSGRYVTEMSVSFGDPNVPRGTLDVLDRVLYMVDDHKLMGRWSLDQLRREGPSITYRVQLQIYGLGAELAGEEVREVALIGWPRQESNLDKLFVHVEPYDRSVAEAALARVGRIAAEVKKSNADAGLDIQAGSMRVAREFETGDDCKWCPFHLKGDKKMERGCPGK